MPIKHVIKGPSAAWKRAKDVPPEFIAEDAGPLEGFHQSGVPVNQATYRGWRYSWRSPHRGRPGGWVRVRKENDHV